MANVLIKIICLSYFPKHGGFERHSGVKSSPSNAMISQDLDNIHSAGYGLNIQLDVEV